MNRLKGACLKGDTLVEASCGCVGDCFSVELRQVAAGAASGTSEVKLRYDRRITRKKKQKVRRGRGTEIKQKQDDAKKPMYLFLSVHLGSL